VHEACGRLVKSIKQRPS